MDVRSEALGRQDRTWQMLVEVFLMSDAVNKISPFAMGMADFVGVAEAVEDDAVDVGESMFVYEVGFSA